MLTMFARKGFNTPETLALKGHYNVDGSLGISCLIESLELLIKSLIID